MRAIAITAYGGRDRLQMMERPDPEAGPGEVLIRIRASGVNPVDRKIREGLLATRMPNHFPLGIGLECSGEVLRCGPGVARVAEGDRVFAYARKEFLRDGTYAERISLPEANVARMPASLSFEEAASIPLAGLTSYQALFEFGALQRGQSVLIHAAAGGTGGFAVQLARYAGAYVIATARRANHAYVRELGAEVAIDYTREDFRAAVRRCLPCGVDLAYDNVGGAVQALSAEAVRPGGLLVTLIAFSDEPALQARGIRTQYMFTRPNPAQLDDLARLVEEGRLRTHLAAVLPWTEAAQAHALIETGHTRGKIVLAIPA